MREARPVLFFNRLFNKVGFHLPQSCQQQPAATSVHSVFRRCNTRVVLGFVAYCTWPEQRQPEAPASPTPLEHGLPYHIAVALGFVTLLSVHMVV